MAKGNSYIPGMQIDEACVLLSSNDDGWLEFATAHPEATIFHHHAWIELINKCYNFRPFVIAVRDSGGKITAGLPMMDISTAFRSHRLVSLPFTDYCNPLYRDAEALERLTAGITTLYHKGICPKIELRWDFLPHTGIYTYSNYIRHTVALSPDAAQVIKRFDRAHRQNTRAAEQKGVRVEQGNEQEQLRLFYQLQLRTRRRHGVPIQPWRFFDMLGEKLFKQGLGFVLLAYRGDECLAGMVILCWNKSLFAKYAASSEDTLNLRPNNLLFWTAIEMGCTNGYRAFDMGRSDIKNEGLRRYKRGWGAEEIPLNYSLLSATHDRHLGDSAIMTMAQKVIRHSPLWVCQLAGELLYRHLA
jgi:CelD/BcsL family acetyltransferase involved in cellulose biosynthesis